jgi:hypothetical protein
MNIRHRVSRTGLILGVALTAVMASIASVRGGTIEGTVTRSDGLTPIAGVNVQLYDEVIYPWGSNYEFVSGGYTDASGNYSFSGLTAGNYRLEFIDWSGNYARETYNNVYQTPWSAGTIVSVSDSGTTNGVNVSLDDAARIEGTITASNGGTPIEGVYVEAYRWTGFGFQWAFYDYTDNNGEYSVGGLPSGSYLVQFDDISGLYIGEIYNNFFGWLGSGGDLLSLSTAQTITGIDAALDDASTISGTVTAQSGGSPIEGIEVIAYRWTGSYWSWDESTTTDEFGQYQIDGLGAGTYRIGFRDWNNVYADEIYDDFIGYVSEGGVNISVGTGVDITEIDATLALGSVIEGIVTELDGVTGIADVYVSALRWTGSGWDYGGWTQTDTSGAYSISGLPAGTYRIEFNSSSGLYPGEYYDDAEELTNATDVVVATGDTISGIDALLARFASIAGAVTAADGVTPLQGIRVVVRRTNDNNIVGTDLTDALGQFLVNWLRPGDYRVHADPSRDGLHLGEWHPNLLYVPGLPPPGGATVISLGSGEALTGYDLSVNDAARIGGTVTGAGLLVLTNARVIALGETYGARADATDSNGIYNIRGLPPDTYRVRVEAENFRDEWWQEADIIDASTPLVVGEGDEITIDFDLAPGQGPAFVEVVSDPAGAQIYLDYQATTNVTPATLDVGEVGSVDALGQRLAPRTLTVKKVGHPRPAVQPFHAVEGETISVLFDLTPTDAGSISVDTTPPGAEVFIDTADAAAGISPVVLNNLAPGSHVILLRKAGYLQPRPILAWVTNSTTNAVSLPLVEAGGPNRFISDARSVPPGATVHVDYLATPSVTDVVLDWMDAASHTGSGWHSTAHTLLLRREGFRLTAPRYVDEITNSAGLVTVNFTVDPDESTDDDNDGLPDEWEAAYDFDSLQPQDSGPDGDPDNDGISNENELRAGTDPRSVNSAFEVEAIPMPNGQNISVTFDSVPGRSYIVLCTGGLLHPWAQASGIIVATGSQTTWSMVLPEADACLYFKVLVLTP